MILMYTGWSPPNLVGRKMGESYQKVSDRQMYLFPLNVFKLFSTEFTAFTRLEVKLRCL